MSWQHHCPRRGRPWEKQRPVPDPGQLPAKSCQQLGACSSRPRPPSPPPGYYTQISTLADAQENVMEYLHVLSRPMVINHDHDITWTEAYIDSKVGPQGASRGSWVGEGWAEHLLGRHCGVTSPPGASPIGQRL